MYVVNGKHQKDAGKKMIGERYDKKRKKIENRKDERVKSDEWKKEKHSRMNAS
jgi:hypothetical protein